MTAFFYQPKLLEKAVARAAEIHRRIHDPSPRDAQLWVTQFLAELEGMERPNYGRIASGLRLSQLRILSAALPRLQAGQLFDKVVACLKVRPLKEVCRDLWGLLGRFFYDDRVTALLDSLRTDPKWSQLTPEQVPRFSGSLKDSDVIVEGLAKEYESSDQSWAEAVMNWQALAPSTLPEGWSDLPLGKACLRRLLLSPRNRLLLRENTSDVNTWVQQLLRKDEDFQGFAKNYLESIRVASWNDDLLVTITNRMGDPRIHAERWARISSKIQEEVVKWLNVRKLAEFFLRGAGDQARFEFWRQFAEEMGPRSEGRIRQRQGFFEFPGFGVIEFMDVNNAAYIYSSQDYLQYLSRRNVSNAQLKDRRRSIERITHNSNWQYTWTPRIRSFIARGKRGLM